MLEMYAEPYVSGFTTNPTLMRKAGVTDYVGFATAAVAAIPDRPISFEVLSDDMSEMEAQARTLAAIGQNVYVKIPVTDTHGVFTGDVISRLTCTGIKVNVTALLSLEQVEAVAARLTDVPACVSVFAGRIADTGRDPMPVMRAALKILRPRRSAELIWASPRELLNVIQAASIGCHIITATNDIIKKLPIIGKDLDQFSLETVCMFHDDARAAGYDVPVGPRDEAVV
jgi:transaldolase